jgi:tetratricopeptide (TPR) repeat protein
MTFNRFGIAVLLAATCLSAPVLANEEPRYAPPPAWVEAPNAPLPDVGKTVRDSLLIQSLEMRLTPGKRDSFFDYAVQVSNAEQLEQLGTITLNWQPDRADLVIHSMTIIRDGKVVDLLAAGKKPTVLRREQELEENSIDGSLTATLPVEGLRVGDILRYSATFEEVESTLGNATEGTAELLTAPQRVGRGATRVIWPSDLPVQWRSFGQKLTPVASEKDGWRQLVVTLPVPEQAKMPDDAPLRFRMKPQLEMSSFADWQAVSRTAAPLYVTEGVIKAGGALEKRIDQIAKASSDPRVRAGLALQMVQDDVRYLYSGLDNGNYVPQQPEETWSLRYGDCKAKTLLLLATLRRLGISADAALVHSKEGDALIDRLPMFGAFDHVIVRAEVGGTDLWLDGTLSGAHLEDLADVPAFSHALPVTTAGSPLVALPSRYSARPQIAMEIVNDQSAGISLPALVTFSTRFRGAMAAGVNAGWDVLDDKKKLEFAAQLATSVSESITPVSVELVRDDKNGLATLRVHAVSDVEWDRSNGKPRLDSDPSLADAKFEVDRGRTAWRNLPVEVEASHFTFHSKYILPGDASAFTLEGDREFAGAIGAGTLERSTSFTGNIVEVKDRITSEAFELPAADIGKARDLVAKAKTKRLILTGRADHPAAWQEVVAARKAGKLAPIEEAYTKAIASQPDEAQPLLNRGYYFNQVFERAKAIADYTAALEIDRTVDTLIWRAWAYDHLRNGAAALDDMRAALELDPSSETAREGEIWLLQHRADYAAALERAEEYLSSAGDDRADWLLTRGHILAESGDLAAGLADLDEANALKDESAHYLSSRCWLRAKANTELDQALADCTRAIESSDNSSDSLDSRGVVYFRMGRFAEALADFDAALKLSSGVSGTMFMRALTLAKLGRKDEGTQDLAGARLQWPGIDDEYARYGLKP